MRLNCHADANQHTYQDSDCDADAFADASHTHAYHQADTHRYFHPNDNSGTLA